MLDLNIYSSKAWRELIYSSLGYETKKLKLIDSDLFYFQKNIVFFRFIGAPLKGSMTPFTDLPSNAITEENINKILMQLFFKSFLFYSELTLNSSVPIKLNAFNNIFYKASSSPTYLLNIDMSIDKLWNRIKSRARNTIRKAEKNNVEVIRVTKPTSSQIIEFYDNLTKTFERSNSKPYHPIVFFEKLFESKVNFLFLIGYKDSTPCSYGIFVYDKNYIYFLSGANNEIGYKNAASSLVQWEALKFACNLKIKNFDFGGAGSSKNIDKFKESFGGTLHHRVYFYTKFSIGNVLINLRKILL